MSLSVRGGMSAFQPGQPAIEYPNRAVMPIPPSVESCSPGPRSIFVGIEYKVQSVRNAVEIEVYLQIWCRAVLSAVSRSTNSHTINNPSMPHAQSIY
ncbi:hypothetical protein VTL71DRAFT_8927 [Oculimacula yallundae]|uniref:Uncharacterized protein n=1 Tax=Oculimacula yallundae TaxID=86028 RepID=A0ABR4BTB0_9HELO